MQTYQREFIEFLLKRDVLKFGEFTLKSGRISPYFFNAGLFNTGDDLAKIGDFYAEAILNSAIEFDVLYGPAYKGIPLACSAAVALATNHNNNIPYSFNRKEAKDHGEGGQIVGASITGKRILLIDDVITAGTAIRESMQILEAEQATLAGIVIALDRQERGQGDRSAIEEVSTQYNVPVINIVSLQDIINFVGQDPELRGHIEAIECYKNQYGT